MKECCSEDGPENLTVQNTLDRREFLKRAAMLSASGLVMLSGHAWAAKIAGDSS